MFGALSNSYNNYTLIIKGIERIPSKMVKTHLHEAEKLLYMLDDQVGKPSVPTFPQTTNQAIVLILKELVAALREMEYEGS
jgi:hypothetical protein